MDAREQDGEDSAGESLSELLRAWRRRPLLRRRVPAAQQRRAQGLSQQEVARLSGVSERWYRSLELGKPANFSADFLDGLASALHLSPVERHVLYLKAAGRPPAEPEGDAEGVMDEQLQHFLDSQAPNPAYASDIAWNIVGTNGPLADWFPWAPHRANLMRWSLLRPEARHQLVDWRNDWARPYLGQIRYVRARHPQNAGLRELERDLLAGSREVRELWALGEVHDHSDGVVRRLRLPFHGGNEVSVSVVAMVPMRFRALRVVVLMQMPRGHVVRNGEREG